MKKFKILSLIMAVILAVGCLSACTDKKEETSVADLGTSVVAEVDGVKIKHSEVGATLISAEREAIQEYLYEKLVKEFFNDKVEISAERIDTELNLMKATVGEENWSNYLLFYGGGSEESFKEMLTDALKQEEYITNKGKEVGITDEEIKAEFDKAPDENKIAVMNCFFCDTEEELDKAVNLVNSGKSITDIATEMSKTLKEEHTFFKSDIIWNKDLNQATVGETVYTTKESGSYVVGSVVELNTNWNDTKVKEEIETKLYQQKGLTVVQEEFDTFLKGKNIKILGEDFSFVPDEAETPVEDVTNQVVEDLTETTPVE